MIINAFFEFLKTAYLFGEQNLLGLLLRVYRNMSGWYNAGILLTRVKNPTVFLRQSITNIISVLFCKETIKNPFESRYIKERDGKKTFHRSYFRLNFVTRRPQIIRRKSNDATTIGLYLYMWKKYSSFNELNNF